MVCSMLEALVAMCPCASVANREAIGAEIKFIQIYEPNPSVLQKYVAHSQIMSAPAGYAALIERFALKLPEPRHTSSIAPGARTQRPTARGVHETFPAQFQRDGSDIGQLVFALKYDGVDLTVLRAAFEVLGPMPLEDALRARPTSSYLRRLWFFYEWLLGTRLDLADTETGAYVDALTAADYVTRPGPKLRRYRVNHNLLSPNSAWCPLVRRTQRIENYAQAGLEALADHIFEELAANDPRDLKRAIRYLYTKETRASFEIEREVPSDRMERFVEVLLARSEQDFVAWWDKDALLEIAAELTPRFAPKDYRVGEVRVSEQRLLSGHERVHYVAPRAVDVPELMHGLLDAWAAWHVTQPARSAEPFLDLVMAGCLSFGFVYIHPFDDGNGRIHRLMLHQVLAKTGFTPDGVVIPISAAILHDQAGYDTALEDFSKRVMPLVSYRIDEAEGALHVLNDTLEFYRYPDLTVQVEALCGWYESAVRTELLEELEVLHAMDRAKTAMRTVVELPDQRENLFLRLCVQNNHAGRGFTLSGSKRDKFADLTESEIAGLQTAIREAFGDTLKPHSK